MPVLKKKYIVFVHRPVCVNTKKTKNKVDGTDPPITITLMTREERVSKWDICGKTGKSKS